MSRALLVLRRPCCLPGTWPTRLERGWAGDGGTDKIGSLWQVGSLRLQTDSGSFKKTKKGKGWRKKKGAAFISWPCLHFKFSHLEDDFAWQWIVRAAFSSCHFQYAGKKTWFMALKLLLHWVYCETKSSVVCIVKMWLSSELWQKVFVIQHHSGWTAETKISLLATTIKFL